MAIQVSSLTTVLYSPLVFKSLLIKACFYGVKGGTSWFKG